MLSITVFEKHNNSFFKSSISYILSLQKPNISTKAQFTEGTWAGMNRAQV